MIQPRLFLLGSCFSLAAFCQDAGRNTISVAVGGGVPTGGEQTFTAVVPSSAAFSVNYEFRLFRYFAPEVSVVNLIPKYITTYDPEAPNYLIPNREVVTLFAFGGRGIVPLRQGRIELFAGAAAVRVFSSDPELLAYASPWIGQISGGGRIAIDRRHRFWIGPAVRFSRNGGRPDQEWVSLTGDFGFRF